MLPIRTDAATRARYSQGAGVYRILPTAVARPLDVATLIRVIEWAVAEGLPITPRGAGSAVDGSNVGAGLILDLTALGTREPEIDRAAGVARVDAGIALSALGTAAARHGLRFGPDPSSAAWATVGGVIATNAAGARSYRLGAVDRWVAALELATTDGVLTLDRDAPSYPAHAAVSRFEHDAAPLLDKHRRTVVERLPRTRKDTAGYGLARHFRSGHLIDLVIGSEGTLGVITAATLRLETIPAVRATLQLTLAERSSIATVVRALEPVAPTTVELFDRSLLQLVATHAGDVDERDAWRAAAAMLLVDLEADSLDELEGRLAAATEAVRGIAPRVRIAREPEAIAAIWAVRHQASPILAGLPGERRSLQVIEDGCVPIAELAAYLDAVDAACGAAGIDAVMFGHAGDGHVHVNLLPDLSRPDWLAAVRQVYAEVTDTLLDLGGTPAGEHGAGRLRAGLLERFVGPEAITCMAAIKRAFDPAVAFNPGVILDDGSDPLARLKVGEHAVPLDAGIADALHRVEVERRWADSRWPARD